MKEDCDNVCERSVLALHEIFQCEHVSVTKTMWLLLGTDCGLWFEGQTCYSPLSTGEMWVLLVLSSTEFVLRVIITISYTKKDCTIRLWHQQMPSSSWWCWSVVVSGGVSEQQRADWLGYRGLLCFVCTVSPLSIHPSVSFASMLFAHSAAILFLLQCVFCCIIFYAEKQMNSHTETHCTLKKVSFFRAILRLRFSMQIFF